MKIAPHQPIYSRNAVSNSKRVVQFGSNASTPQPTIPKSDQPTWLQKGMKGIKDNLAVTLGVSTVVALIGLFFPPLLGIVALMLPLELIRTFVVGARATDEEANKG